MSTIVLALVPVFLLIALGYAIRQSKFLDETFWGPADRITFYVFFPALLFRNLAIADFTGLAIVEAVGALVAAIVIVTTVVLVLRGRLGLAGPGFTSLLQGSIRPNTYVGLAAAFALFGDAGVSLAAIGVVAFVPLVNVISATALARYAAHTRPDWWATAGLVARNPLILACLAGILVNLNGAALPPIVGPVLEILGRAALPLGLISVGAGLELGAMRRAGGPVLLASGFKLLALPALAALGLRLLGVDGATFAVALMFAALPTSATSYVMARQLGGDYTLMASIITAETLFAVVTLPAWLILLG